jgi:hypothetical protein
MMKKWFADVLYRYFFTIQNREKTCKKMSNIRLPGVRE